MACKICAVATGKTVEECLRQIKGMKNAGASAVELRLDFLDTPGFGATEMLVKASKRLGLEIIITCRPKWEGGKFKGKEEARKKVLLCALDAKPDLVDVELKSAKEFDDVIKKAKKNKARVIVSFHDFEKTPPLLKLEKILEKEFAAGASIGKIACLVQEKSDSESLLELLKRARKKRRKAIILGMGEKSGPVRISSCLLGSEYCFAKSGKSGSAPGQLSISQMAAAINGKS